MGSNHAHVANTITSLAQLLQATNRPEEAEPLYRRALTLRESSLGPEHPLLAVSLNSVATILAETNRFSEAEALIRRALEIQERDSPDQWGVSITLNNLALLSLRTDRRADAEPLLRRALTTAEKALGAKHWAVANLVNNLAYVLQEAGRFEEAEPLYRRALSVSETSLGSNHPSVAQYTHNLAWLLHATGRLADAEPLYRRSLATFEASLGRNHPSTVFPLINLAGLFAELGDWPTALALHSRTKPIITGRSAVELSGRTEVAEAKLTRNAVAFRAHARAAYRADAGSVATREEGFEAAQWALQSTAADALTKMSARFAKGSGPLAALVREHQDLIIRRRTEDKRLIDAVGKADAKASEAIRAATMGLDANLDVIDRRLAAEFPEYVELSSPKPLSTGEVQALLQPDEALIVFLDIPQAGKLSEETVAWAVTNREARWINIPLGTGALAERVASLRCGLDREGQWKWFVRRWEAKGEHCRALKPDGLAESEPLPFDLGVAHELYAKLLAPFADLTKDKSLIIVPSGPLTSLPFHVLVTEAPKGSVPKELTSAAWLALRQSVTVLPSVGSLKALRKLPPSRAGQPYIAFGNPLLDGGSPNGMPAKLAHAKQSCPREMKSFGRRVVDTPKGVPGLGALFRGGIDLAELRGLAPLPETADELCAVAGALGALGREADTVWLGRRATEANLKALSRSGRLAQYRVLHFATHGVLAGESEEILKARAEPALILSPPRGGATRQQLEEDDGLLSASEVAQLELDADWVVLSACNTAAGEKGNAEALSGLARAFFYAKARALLVSHWAVTSDAAVKLTTGTFDELRAAPKIGRAEALRRSMKRLISSGHPHEVHPEYWAPFVVVGEGGAGA